MRYFYETRTSKPFLFLRDTGNPARFKFFRGRGRICQPARTVRLWQIHHAIAKQTIGGLAQGLSIEKPVVFEGGPLTFNRTLVRVFAERLDLRPEEILSPDRPELLIACGAARAAVKLFSKEEALATADGLLDRIEKVRAAREEAKKQSEAGNGETMVRLREVIFSFVIS